MFASMRYKLRDAKIIADLCTVAEHAARSRGEEAPGSEHFVLASLELQDGSAIAAFKHLGLTSASFAEAVRAQFSDALHSVGIRVPAVEGGNTEEPVPAGPRPRLYRAAPSGEELMQRLADASPPGGTGRSWVRIS